MAMNMNVSTNFGGKAMKKLKIEEKKQQEAMKAAATKNKIDTLAALRLPKEKE
eukprot:CAMPEP_0183713644 /NCGR_PEP_ID=MMETSP0737-20130205/8431_1 /TAXON_ID=385413 /ORGANISM="Thalassiosira miniscula, Strain CCMP1093" /LENGTH=52 /DNA_ID=CAMNT_0025942461 /DNA_START=1479 /DNA_END=1637 /DNA_ORIENTATION=+